MLVIGDGHVTFLSSLIPRIVHKVFTRRNIPLQVQIHHEVVKRSPRDGFLVYLKYFMTKFAIRSANSVRVTTNLHSDQVEKVYGYSENKIVPIPVRINFSRTTERTYPYPRNRSIGIVGRLHRERDLQISFKVIKLLNEVENNFNVLVIGEGPEEISFREELTRELGPERVDFLGYLNQGDLERAWMKIGVLLSTARQESFGRTIRESLCHGVPALVEKSLGSEEVSSFAPTGWLSFINHPLNQTELLEQFSALLGIKTDNRFAISHDLRNAQIPEQLVTNWLKTIKNSS
jgi:glycosyltransferase involved in cell wall biosynthesis